MEIDRGNSEIVLQDEIVEIEQLAQLVGEAHGLQQVLQADRAPRHLVFIGRANALAGGTDLAGALGDHRLDEGDKLLGLLNLQRFNEHTQNLIEVFKFATPYAVCPYCGGDAATCKACHGLGFVSKMAYESAPRELTSKGA